MNRIWATVTLDKSVEIVVPGSETSEGEHMLILRDEIGRELLTAFVTIEAAKALQAALDEILKEGESD